MPTPTPIPSSQVVQTIQAVQNTVDSAAQQGAITVVIIIAFTVLVLAVAYLLTVVTRRNSKPDNSGTNNLIESQTETLKELREEFRQERIGWRAMIEVQVKNFTEAVAHLGDGYNRMGDILARQTTMDEAVISDRKADTSTLRAMKLDVNQMVTVGSVPLRNLIDQVHANKNDTNARLDRLEKSVEGLNTTIQGLPNCEMLTEQVATIKSEIIEAIREKAKGDTAELLPIDMSKIPEVIISGHVTVDTPSTDLLHAS